MNIFERIKAAIRIEDQLYEIVDAIARKPQNDQTKDEHYMATMARKSVTELIATMRAFEAKAIDAMVDPKHGGQS